MLRKLIPIIVLPLFTFVQPAEARRLFWWEVVGPEQPQQQVYGAHEYQDLYGAPNEEFNQRQYHLYQREIHRRYLGQAGITPQDGPDGPPPSFYDQQNSPLRYAAPIRPKPKKIAKVAPVIPHSVAQVPTPAPAPTSTQDPQVTSAPPVKSGQPVNCEKGAAIVTGFGFEDVKTQSCEAGTLAYNAKRSGQPFTVSVNPKTGELIAVKRLPLPTTQTQTEL